ncbi:class I glutamine amidotransferase-like protein [Russula aff. rugulosa BPL654]|nr:class I glutamine amidotransferase-like protein [Russula aff. rugulosa BPL654]
MPSALVLIANGTEEMEFTIVYDTLVRAGVTCTSAFVTSGQPETAPDAAQCSRGVRIVPDTSLSQLSSSNAGEYDAIIIPDYFSSSLVQSLVKNFYEKGKLVGMICAASLVAKSSHLPRQPLTSHPSVKEQLDKDFDYREDSVVISGNLITRLSYLILPGTAFPFAFALVERLCGAQKRAEVIGPMVFPPGTPL